MREFVCMFVCWYALAYVWFTKMFTAFAALFKENIQVCDGLCGCLTSICEVLDRRVCLDKVLKVCLWFEYVKLTT